MSDRMTTADLVAMAAQIAQTVEANDDLELLPEDAQQQLADWFVTFDAGGAEKIEALYHVVKGFEVRAGLLKQEEERLAARRKRLERSRDSVKQLALLLLEAREGLTGETKIESATVTAYLQRRQRVVLDVDLEALLEERPDLVRTSHKPDLVAIRHDLKAGRPAPAHLEETKHVTFR